MIRRSVHQFETGSEGAMQTMDMILTACAEAHPTRLALTLDDQRVSFGEVGARVNQYAAALHGWGVRRGDVALTFCDMAVENVFIHYAMAKLGAVFAPMDAHASAVELDQIVDYVEPRFLIVDAARQELGAAAAQRTGVALGVVAPQEKTTAGTNLACAAAACSDAFSSPDPPQPDDIHALYFTSGSTGRPKGAMISHRANWLRAYFATNFPSSRGMVSMFPLFHIAGWQVISQCWARRRAAHLVRRADAEELLGAVERWGASTLYAIPAVWKRILECRKTFDVRSLRAADAGTSYVGPDLIRQLRERFPEARNVLAYGSTEIGLGLQIDHEDILRKPGSVGLPGPGVAARLVDGELLLRGSNMMDGYYKLPAETAEALTDGWYQTGDLAECDDEGYYTIIGRRREIIRSGGKTVAPAELDALLKRVENVADIAAVGLPDSDWGEVVAVAVARRDGAAAPTLEEIRSALGDISKHKLPRLLYEVAFIPRTKATGQVRRTELREMILAKQTET